MRLVAPGVPGAGFFVLAKLGTFAGDRSLASVTGPSGVVFDARFREHAAPYEHPERPERLAAIEARLEREKLLGRCQRVPARLATDAELLAVHTEGHVSEMDATARRAFTQLDADTYAVAASAAAARLAAGGLIELTRAVLNGRLSNGFALVRPPGHHAEADRAMGFCLFNNVAVAARAALAAGARRVLIVDWDLHHGNGTQNAFWDEPRVVYFSTHQSPLYPGTGEVFETGGAEAPGHILNVPWPAGRGDADHLSALRRLLVPVALQFAPDLTIVSCGFDAARGDLLGSQLVSPGGFAAMTRILMDSGDGRVVLALEGGYALEAIAGSAAACLRVLLGDEGPAAEEAEPTAIATRAVDEAVLRHAELWPGLR